MSTEGASPTPPSPQAVIMGMENTPSPSFSITPFIFGFLKSLDLQSVGLNSNVMPTVHLITRWEIVVYDPVMAASRLGGLEVESVGQSKEFNVEHVGNEFVIEDAEDSDEDEPILRFKRTVPTKSQMTTELTLKRQRKTTTSPNVTLAVPLSQPRTRSSGLPIVLPLSKDRVESPIMGKKKNPPLNLPKHPPKHLSKHPPKHPSNQFHLRNLPKNGLP